jgi:hypothetical protein
MGVASRMKGRIVILGLVALAIACPKDDAPKLTFTPYESPSGVPDPQTVKDEAIDEVGRVGIDTVLLLPATLEYEQLDRLLQSIGRQARTRSGFKNAPRPQFVDVRIYTDAARTGDANAWVGRLQLKGDGEPLIEMKLPFPLGKTVRKMIDERPEYGTIKPKVDSGDAEGRLELTVPYVTAGEDQYVKKLGYGDAIQEFNSWALMMFRKFPALKDFTFVGEHNGKEVVRIRITREQYDQINITKVEEDLGAFSGEFLVGQMQGAISDEAVQAKLAKKRREVYGAMLKQLPPDQVVISKTLK